MKWRRGHRSPDLRARGPELTRRVVDEIWRTSEAFARTDEEFRGVVDAVVGRIVDTILTAWTTARDPSRDEISELVHLLLPPTDRGITLEDMLEVFRLAMDVMWDELHRLIETREVTDPAVILELSHRGAALVDLLGTGVTNRYLEGDRWWLKRDDAERGLVAAVLNTPPNIDVASSAAQALGLRLSETWRVVQYAPQDGADLDRLRDALVTWRRGANLTAVVATHDDAVLLVLSDGTAPPRFDGTIAGMGRAQPGVQGLRASYAEATEATAIARSRGRDALAIEEAGLDRLLLGTLSASDLAEESLAPLDDLPEARREMLEETLEAWLDAGTSPTETARTLNLHVQSARYRIERLRDTFGDALEDPDHRLRLHVAIKARLRGSLVEPPTDPELT